MKRLPVVAITMGDPAGIGPEIVLKALTKREIFRCSIPIIIGDKKFLKKTADSLNIPPIPSNISIIDLKNIPERFTVGKPSRSGGKATVKYIDAAVNLALHIRVELVTTHTAIKNVSRLISRKKILKTIKLTNSSLKSWGFLNPRIGVSALNPHGGEGGIFGNEEIKKIMPAINDARAEGIKVQGPFPADTLFTPAKMSKFDAIVVMYHDQGLITIKMK